MASIEPQRHLDTPGGNPSASQRSRESSVGGTRVEASRTPITARSGGRAVAPEQEAAKAWIRAHEELALISAFALGVFIGTLMKS